MSAESTPQFLKVEQVAELLGVGKSRIYKLVNAGLPCIRLGKRRGMRFDVKSDEWRQWLESRKG
jgi:excisionase family DNA binding protein